METPRDGLLGRLSMAWADFSWRADAVPSDRWEAPTSAGWSVRAMLAHVAAWHDATAFRLRRYAATGKPQPKVEPDDDAFNARVVADTVDSPPDVVRRSLDGSYERLWAAIAALPADLDAEGWVEAVVTGNSIGHYEEHRSELESIVRG
ncbi:MAG: maleylpyruvate isomerase N-terminal domain-containing protein [Chloroflexi bacterium]|nr:maleylpyruvate isomerase N-terminal domain-containing protein [Chloroflexota bacterium]